ncbi:MAG: hypothetical protein ACMXYF_01535 [Candidatus Woesearchaeota archaeon]
MRRYETLQDCLEDFSLRCSTQIGRIRACSDFYKQVVPRQKSLKRSNLNAGPYNRFVTYAIQTRRYGQLRELVTTVIDEMEKNELTQRYIPKLQGHLEQILRERNNRHQ